MNPYLWVMCNDSEEGRRLPSLMALKAIEPNDSSMEVVLVDRYGDTRLMELENRAQELYYASESTLVLVEKLLSHAQHTQILASLNKTGISRFPSPNPDIYFVLFLNTSFLLRLVLLSYTSQVTSMGNSAYIYLSR